VRVGGLDLARRRDFSALVVLDHRPDRLIVTKALRLPHRPFADQLAALTPLIGSLDRLAFDAGGIGDAVSEHPALRDAVPVLIVSGEGVRLAEGRWRVGKTRLVSDLLHLARAGRLGVRPECLGAADLRHEMQNFAMLPTKRGVRLAARGAGQHDDLVLAAALAVFAARLVGKNVGKPERPPLNSL
jgi:phage FluMu gp28-like protein